MGSWKSLKEMEDSLTLDELYALLAAMHRKEHRHNSFMASLKGINLDEELRKAKSEDFERVQQRANAALAGKTEENYVFDLIGIEIEDDDE